jgi:zinc protease
MPKKYQLKNGMKVLTIQSAKSPVVSIQAWVNTGSADEIKGEEGISHFIEHLVFKGTNKFKVGEIASSVEGAGGVLNAYTTFDQTVFYVTISKEHLETGLDVISQMMGYPQFDEKEIDNEREVVIEEIKRSLDSPRSLAGRQLFSAVYSSHPYGIPVIGYEENILKVSSQQIKKYFNDRYSPQNIKLLIVGDFEQKNLDKKVDESFGALKKFKIKKVTRKKELVKKNKDMVLSTGPQPESYIYLAWPTPDIKSKDVVPLMLLSSILGEGESSRLVNQVRNQKNAVNSIGCFLFTAKDNGFFSIAVSLQKENINKALHEINSQLELFFTEGISDEEVIRAQRIMESEKLYSMETVDGLAGLYGHSEFFYGDYKKTEKLLSEIKKVNAKKIIAIAKKYLRPENLIITAMAGKETEVSKELESFRADYKIIFKKPVKKIKQKKEKSKKTTWVAKISTKKNVPEKIILDNGTRVIVKKINGSPVLSARLAGLGGLRYENPELSGLNELSSRVWSSGTRSKNEKNYHTSLEKIATGINAFGGRNTLGISMTTLVPFAKEASQLFSEVITEPIFEQRIVEREIKQMIDQIEMRKDKPGQLCMLALAKKLYPDHPYGRDPLGDESTLKKITNRHVEDYIFKTLGKSNRIYSIVGEVQVDVWLKKIHEIEKNLSKEKIKPVSYTINKLTSNTLLYEKSDKKQSHIALGFHGLKFSDKRRYALDVLQAILSGQGGRLFIELRDKASLAYTVTPIRMDGIESGYFGTYIGCSPEKAQKAYKMMYQELMKLGEKSISAEELERAQKYLIGRHDISSQRTSTLADALLFDELYEIPFNEYDKHNEKIKAITQKDVQTLAQELFSQKYVLSVIGQENVSI